MTKELSVMLSPSIVTICIRFYNEDLSRAKNHLDIYLFTAIQAIEKSTRGRPKKSTTKRNAAG